MARLQPFSTMKEWMAGSQPIAPEHSQELGVGIDMATSPQRRRVSGLRQDTDESCDLPTSADVLQHLTSSKFSGGILHLGDDARRYTSYATTLGSQDEPQLHLDSHEQMLAQVNALKEELHELKRNRERSAQASAAFDAQCENRPSSYSAFGVPAAEIAKAGATSDTPQRQVRGSFTSAHEHDGSIIISPRNDIVGDPFKSVAKGASGLSCGKAAKSPPHFAQPTASFSRRSGGITSHVVGAQKPSPRSPQSPDWITVTPKAADKRKKRKRDTLPGHWTNVGQAHNDAPPKQHSASQVSGLALIAKCKTTQPPQSNGQQLRKKTSSYMSPTKAATQRAIATLGEGTARHNFSKASLSTLKFDANIVQRPTLLTGSPAIVRPATPVDSPAVLHRGSNKKIQVSPCQKILKCTAVASWEDYVESEQVIGTPYETPTKVLAPAPSKTKTLVRSDSSKLKPVPHEIWSSLPKAIQQRRTSRADILEPIYHSLEKAGLHKDNPDISLLSDDAIKSREDLTWEEEARKTSAALQNIALLARQGVASRSVTLPPHLEQTRRQVGTTSAATEAIGAPVMQKESSGDSATMEPERVGSLRDDAADQATDTKRKVSAANSSLRATAKSFTPRWTPQTAAQELGIISWQGTLDEYSSEEWARLPNYVKESIKKLRSFKREGTASGSSSPIRGVQPSRRAEQRFWGRIMGTDKVTTPAREDDAHPPGYVVQAGQRLVPELSPGKGHVQWTLEDLDGQKRPVTFDRAPPPPAYTAMMQSSTYHTPAFAAEATSCMNTTTGHSEDPFAFVPYSNRPWTVSPSYGADRRPYGWKGGDGKEISFSGYGPLAESNLAGAYNMFFQSGRAPGYEARPSEAARPKVWPRSRKQWEEYAASATVPCPTMHVDKTADCYSLEILSVACNDSVCGGDMPSLVCC